MSDLTDRRAVPVRAAAGAAGRALVVAGIVGAVAEALLFLWPDRVPESVFSNPLDTTGFAISQLFFFLHHAVLALGLAFLTAELRHQSRATLLGGVTATVGAAVWTIGELVAIPFASDPADQVNRGLVGTMFGLGCTLVGLGMIVLGVASLRHGRRRIGTAACGLGLAEFLILLPGVVSNVDLLQHLAIGVWMLLFAAVGAALVAESARTRVP